jgi:sporulation protein YlmC with PRC-barrel domain
MTKKLFATTALVTLLSAPAYADGLNLGLDTNVDAGVEVSSDENKDGINLDLGADAEVEAGTETNQDGTNTSADTSVDGNVDLNSDDQDKSITADIAADAMLATDLLGEEVHTQADANLQIVGDVNDIVMDEDGNADWLIVGVGGFLGLGEKEVAISADQVAWANIDNEQVVVTQMTQAEFEAANAFDRAELQANGEYTAEDLSWTAEGEARLSAEQ